MQTTTGKDTKYRFTVYEFHLMGEAGIFSEDDRVELIDGEVVEMSPIGWRHALCVTKLNKILARFAIENTEGRNYDISPQNPVILNLYGEPRPDLVLVEDAPVGRHPGPENAALVVEVSDTSLAYDRNTKLPRYAAAGIPEVWIVDLNANRIEVHSKPASESYRETLRFERPERVASATIQNLTFDAAEALPPEEG